MALRAISLFAGVGGLDLGFHMATGGRTVCFVERDSYAASVLVARMEDSALEQAPVWDDITTFDGTAWCGAVDIVLGGFPCQDLSVAGKQAGLAGGERSSLWSEMLRIANECEARLIFAENVPAIRSADGRDVEDGADHTFRERALGSVLRDLAESGWNAEWLCLRASDVGAPHQRERWFMLAYRDDCECSGQCADWQERDAAGRCGRLADGNSSRAESFIKEGASRSTAGERGRDVDNSMCARLEECRTVRRGQGEAELSCEALADTLGHELRDEPRGRSRESRPGEAKPGDDVPIFAPGPCDSAGWLATLANSPHLAPAIEPGFCLLADGFTWIVDASRADQLRCCGNGVVPLQAAVAFVELFWRIERSDK